MTELEQKILAQLLLHLHQQSSNEVEREKIIDVLRLSNKYKK